MDERFADEKEAENDNFTKEDEALIRAFVMGVMNTMRRIDKERGLEDERER